MTTSWLDKHPSELTLKEFADGMLSLKPME